MARGKPVEGVDFEWKKVPGSNARSRNFFTAAEKKARAEKAKSKASAPKKTTSTKRKEPATAKSVKTPKVTTTSLGKANNRDVASRTTDKVKPVKSKTAAKKPVTRRQETKAEKTMQSANSKTKYQRGPLMQAIKNAIDGKGPTNPKSVKLARKAGKGRDTAGTSTRKAGGSGKAKPIQTKRTRARLSAHKSRNR